jgi:hypothetical protein
MERAMTKKDTRVKLWHPGYKATANPLKTDLSHWTAKGWVRQPTQPKEEGESK